MLTSVKGGSLSRPKAQSTWNRLRGLSYYDDKSLSRPKAQSTWNLDYKKYKAVFNGLSRPKAQSTWNSITEEETITMYLSQSPEGSIYME